MRYFIATVFLLLSFSANSQNLMNERIRKISTKKRAVFLNNGIFHNGSSKVKAQLKAVRHNYSKRMGYERLVFDFDSKKMPRIYGHIDAKNKKLYFDMFKTQLPKNVESFGNSFYVKDINFYPISSDSVSVEISFKEQVSVDLFYLLNPGRFVVDIKN